MRRPPPHVPVTVKATSREIAKMSPPELEKFRKKIWSEQARLGSLLSKVTDRIGKGVMKLDDFVHVPRVRID